MFKTAFWIVIIGSALLVGSQVIPVFYNNLKVENVFEGTAKNLKGQSENKVKSRIGQLLRVQSVDVDALPKEFFDNIEITTENNQLQIGSQYHITLWLLGEPVSIDPDEEYKESDVKGMDKLRLKGRMDFDFAPFAESQ